jgi:serine/threonine protein kinase
MGAAFFAVGVASVSVTLQGMYGSSNVHAAAREAHANHAEGAARQRVGARSVDAAESSSAIPRRRVSEVTRPLEPDHRRPGPSFQDVVRLERGEIESLCLADRYRIGRWLGRGGMAIVFRGETLDLGHSVAIKILVEPEVERSAAVSRFLREARLSTRIHHENVVEVVDYGSTPEGLVYLAMELLRGEDLRALIAQNDRGLPWARVRALMLQICEGLAAVHDAGIVHQDLKPANCFRVVGEGGERIKLIDFGVATTIADREAPTLIVGTPRYMSPEQARGVPVDVRSDVYSAGIILCELLTGRVPFTGTPIAVLAAQLDELPPTLQALAPEGTRIDPAIQAIYERTVAKEPALRFSSVRELAAAIRAVEPTASCESSGVVEPAAIGVKLDAAGTGEPARGRSRWNQASGTLAAL